LQSSHIVLVPFSFQSGLGFGIVILVPIIKSFIEALAVDLHCRIDEEKDHRIGHQPNANMFGEPHHFFYLPRLGREWQKSVARIGKLRSC
jgi:hypothetical protein